MAINIEKRSPEYEGQDWYDYVTVISSDNIAPIDRSLKNVTEGARNTVITIDNIPASSWSKDPNDSDFYLLEVNHNLGTSNLVATLYNNNGQQLFTWTTIKSNSQFTVGSDEAIPCKLIVVADIY